MLKQIFENNTAIAMLLTSKVIKTNEIKIGKCKWVCCNKFRLELKLLVLNLELTFYNFLC